MNTLVLSIVKDYLRLEEEVDSDGSFRHLDNEVQALRTVSRHFQKCLYDIILRPDVIQKYMEKIFPEIHRSVARLQKLRPQLWFEVEATTQFSVRKELPGTRSADMQWMRRLSITTLEDTDVFIWFLIFMTPLRSSYDYVRVPDDLEEYWYMFDPDEWHETKKDQCEWMCELEPCLRAVRWLLRAAVQHTNTIFVWETSFARALGCEENDKQLRHRLSWINKPERTDPADCERLRGRARLALALLSGRRRLRGKQKADNLHFVNPLITIIGGEVSDELWNLVLERASVQATTMQQLRQRARV